MVITVSCPACATSFPVDPNKIPEAGVKVRCSQCAHVFRVERPSDEPRPVAPPAPEPELAAPEPEIETPQAGLATPASEPEGADTVEPEPQGPDLGGGELTVADDWGIERDASEQAAAAEPPATEPTVDSIPDGGAEMPDWAVTEARTEGDGHDASPSPAVTPVEPDPVQGLPELEVEPAEGLSEPEPEAEAEAEPLPAPEPEPLSEPEPLPAPEPEPLVQGQAPATPAAPDEPVQGFTFGKRDPMDKARRLARVLVSDMVMYNAERHQEALANGTLAEDFEEEIEKSWKEFVEQVGAEIAEGEGQHFWTQALNDILAKGQTVF